jgi:hypothetical protein
MIWDRIMEPHSFWGLVLEIGGAVGVVWLLGFWFVCLVGWLLDGGSTPSKRPSTEVARLGEYRGVIDALYDRAEREVQRIIDRSHGG